MNKLIKNSLILIAAFRFIINESYKFFRFGGEIVIYK